MSETSAAQSLMISVLGSPLVTIILWGTESVVPSHPIVGQLYAFSRFAYLHTQDGQMVLESPLAHAQVILHDWRSIAILHSLAQPKTLAQLCHDFPNLSEDVMMTFLSWLLGGKFLAMADEDGTVTEEPSLRLWEFHDLLFHTRSRLGRHKYPYGKSTDYLGKIAPLPAVKPLMSSQVIPLYEPNIAALMDHDISLTRAIEERHSLRQQGEQPITIEQFGEFLYRTARTRSVKTTESVAYEFSDRPYPSGGACYELELYVAVNACQGLAPGLYHYCPQEHVLCQVQGYTLNVLKLSYQAAPPECLPQLLIVLTARFPRVMWKYRSLAYALILKHVGVLYQSMYLVATAMGLASCAIGGGDSDLFAQAVAIDYYAETSVGEFILGSRGTKESF